MRSGLLAVVVAWLAACDPSTGLQFELDATGDPTARTIAVYIGKGDGQGASIAAEERTPSDANDGRFWPFGLPPESFELTGSDRSVTLSFEPGGASSKVTIVVVGLTDGVATSVAAKTVTRIPTDVIAVWTLALEPLDGDRAVQRWGERPGDLTCVQARDRSAVDPDVKNIFIGTGGDRDCDGHRKVLDNDELNPAECDDDWHGASVTPSSSTLSCMEDVALASLQRACMIGGRECTDGEPGSRRDCSHRLPFCAPQALCDACPQGSVQERFACALELDPSQHSGLPHLECVFDINVAASPPQVCPMKLVVQAPGSDPSTTGCTATPSYHSADPATGWTSVPEYGGIAFALTAGTSTSCAFFITPSLIPGRAVDTNPFPVHGIMAVDRGARPGIIAPIVFIAEKVNDCSVQERSCTLASPLATPDESIVTCLRDTGAGP